MAPSPPKTLLAIVILLFQTPCHAHPIVRSRSHISMTPWFYPKVWPELDNTHYIPDNVVEALASPYRGKIRHDQDSGSKRRRALPSEPAEPIIEPRKWAPLGPLTGEPPPQPYREDAPAQEWIGKWGRVHLAEDGRMLNDQHAQVDEDGLPLRIGWWQCKNENDDAHTCWNGPQSSDLAPAPDPTLEQELQHAVTLVHATEYDGYIDELNCPVTETPKWDEWGRQRVEVAFNMLCRKKAKNLHVNEPDEKKLDGY